MEQRADLFDQPHEFGRLSKRRRLSSLCDRGQTCAHLDASVIRTMLSLGARISFVQKISALSGFRSIRADFLEEDFNLKPTLSRVVSGKGSENHLDRAVLAPTTEAAWQSQQFGRRHRRPDEADIPHRDENPVCTDGQQGHHSRHRNTRRGRCRRV